MSALDINVVNIVLPIVRAEFGVPVSTIEWVVTIYPLFISGLLLTFGRLGDIYGHRRIYLVGFSIFVTSSVVAGLAPAVGMLIVARAVQAIGGAMLQANSPAIVSTTFPGKQRGQALGMLGSLTYLGVMVGPPIGGWLATHLSWRAVFYVNVPIGLIAAALAWWVVPRLATESTYERFDVSGALLFILSLSGLLLAVNRAQVWGWRSPMVLGLALLALLLAGVFIRTERRVAEPMLDLSLFRRWLFTASALSAVLNYFCVFAILFLMPFYLIDGRGFSPDRAGLFLMAQSLVMAILAPISGYLSDRMPSRKLASLGLVVQTGGLFLLSRLGPSSPPAQILLGLAVVGLGIGTFAPPNNNALLGSASRQRQGIASGVLATARNVGASLGVGLTSALFAAQMAAHSQSGAGNATAEAVPATFLYLAGVAALGAVVSYSRGRLRRSQAA